MTDRDECVGNGPTADEPREPYGESSIFFADRPAPGVLRLTLDTGHPNNLVTHANHREFSEIWAAVASDEAQVVLVRGVGGVLCGGGDMSFLPPLLDDAALRSTVHEDIRSLVRNMLDCPKPIVTAIEGLCSGAGLAMAIMADVPFTARSATLIDAHVMVGLTAGDHAALAWPLLMGMAKAKYHLLSATPMTGEQAERNGLVACCTDDAELHHDSLAFATRLAQLPPDGVALTKRALGGWFQMAMPIFEQSAALEAGGFSGAATRAIVERWQAPDADPDERDPADD